MSERLETKRCIKVLYKYSSFPFSLSLLIIPATRRSSIVQLYTIHSDCRQYRIILSTIASQHIQCTRSQKLHRMKCNNERSHTTLRSILTKAKRCEVVNNLLLRSNAFIEIAINSRRLTVHAIRR